MSVWRRQRKDAQPSGSARAFRRYLPVALAACLLLAAGCAKYNTYHNAKRAFETAEQERKERVKRREDVTKPTSGQKKDYDLAIKKAQIILDEYPGHGLTDDALFLQAKAYNRINSYRMSIRKLDLLFTNFPATSYEEEAYFIQAMNYLLVGDLLTSQDYLGKLDKSYPDSKFQAEALQVSGESAFVLEDWDDATASFEAYLEQFPDAEARDDIRYKLAQSLWELEEYERAAPVLSELAATADSRELAFKARLLLARVQVRLGDVEATDDLLASLRSEAEAFQSQGEVVLVEAEAYVYQGRDDQASPLLENMPEEWATRTLQPRAKEVLGYIYLRRGDWEESRTAFQEAVKNKDELEHREDTPLLLITLQDYLAAEQSLVDADPQQAASLKLLQANAMLFGFSRPREAADLYVEVAASDEADSLVSARALYGATVVFRRYLDNPDSADLFAEELERRYPESPQAYQIAAGEEANLLEYLLALEAAQQSAALAAGGGELAAAGRAPGAGPEIRRGPGSGLRRRMIYFQRRPNLVFPPPPEALRQLADAQRAELAAATAAVDSAGAVFDSIPAAGSVSPVGADEAAAAAAATAGGAAAGSAAGDTAPTGAGSASATADSLFETAPDSVTAAESLPVEPEAQVVEPEPEPEEPKKKVFDLR